MTANARIRIIVCLISVLVAAPFAGAAEKTRTYLKDKFQDGDIPTGQDFQDFIDSALNLVDDGLTSYRVGVDGPLGQALRLEAGAVVGPGLSYAPISPHPPLAPLWAGEFGFLPLEFRDSSSASHYGFLQMRMASGPLPPPPGEPGSAIFVEYLVWETDANVPLATRVVPEPASALLMLLGVVGRCCCRRARCDR